MTRRDALIILVALAVIVGCLLVTWLAPKAISHYNAPYVVPPSAIHAITTPPEPVQASEATRQPLVPRHDPTPTLAPPRSSPVVTARTDTADVVVTAAQGGASSARWPTASGMRALRVTGNGDRLLPLHSLADLVFVGTASFYDAGSGIYAALPGPWRAGRWVRVCGMAACVRAPVVTTCGCAGPPPKAIDLSPQLFERVSGLSTALRWQFGVTSVSVVILGGAT